MCPICITKIYLITWHITFLPCSIEFRNVTLWMYLGSVNNGVFLFGSEFERCPPRFGTTSLFQLKIKDGDLSSRVPAAVRSWDPRREVCRPPARGPRLDGPRGLRGPSCHRLHDPVSEHGDLVVESPPCGQHNIKSIWAYITTYIYNAIV